jgi:signal transduction histidine kinase
MDLAVALNSSAIGGKISIERSTASASSSSIVTHPDSGGVKSEPRQPGWRGGCLHPGSDPRLRPEPDADIAAPRYRRAVSKGPGDSWIQPDEARPVVPAFSLTPALVGALTDPGRPADLVLVAIPVVAFAAWAYVPRVSLPMLSLAVIVPVVYAQRSGDLEPLLFEVSLLGFVVGRWASTFAEAVPLGVLAVAAPIAASMVQDPSEIAAAIWVMGIAFPWLIGVAAARQSRMAAQLDAARRELTDQAILAERRQIARDVHDSVGHGLAAVMLQLTSARHVLRRDPAAAEEALRTAEEVGRRSMQELRGTVALLRSDDEAAIVPPLPSANDIRALVDDADAGGLEVELRTRGELALIPPAVGVALYRIGQEALANAASHAPRARTVVEIEVADGQARFVAETTGPTLAGPVTGAERPRYGLIGMRERATALGGELAAGPTPEGWRVSCLLPLAGRGATRVWEGRGP